MSNFLTATKQAIDTHGLSSTYKQVVEGEYNVETGTATNTETSFTLKIYKKHLKADQYNYPNLIGKDAAIFYIANDNLSFKPSSQDVVTYGSDTYKVESSTEFVANGVVVLYKVLAVKG
jgi:hypothetical protein